MRRLAKNIAELESRISEHRDAWLHVVGEVCLHRAREEAGEPCPCCGSEFAEIIERRQVAEFWIDGRRRRRLDHDPGVPARRVTVLVRAHHDYGDLLAEGRHVFASGGHRSGKTTTGLAWLTLRWLLRGGRGRRFWLVAQTDPAGYRLAEKLFEVLPSALVMSRPDGETSRNLTSRLADGSTISVRSFANDPAASRAKSDPIVAALVDEAAHLPSEAWIAALRGRCLDLGGHLWFASTAIPESKVQRLVDDIQSYSRGDEKAVEGAAWCWRQFPLLQNPWLDGAAIRAAMTSVDLTRPENRRDYFGEWIANEGLCWVDFEAERHVVAHEARSVAGLGPRLLASYGAAGHVDITPRVARGLFGRPNPHVRNVKASCFAWILGQDVNISPMSTALLQITAPADTIADRDTWHYWVVDTVSSLTSNSIAHAERLTSTELARVLDPHGTSSPLRGCGVIVDATSIGRDPTASRHLQRGSSAEHFAKFDLDARAPAYRPSPRGPGHHNPELRSCYTLMHRVIRENRLHVFSRCSDLLNTFAEQRVGPDGIQPIDARRGYFDRIAGPMDALRYAVFAAANVRLPQTRSWSELPRE